MTEGVVSHGEADTYHGVPGLQDARAPVLRCGRGEPWFDVVVDERVIGPLGELVDAA